jgi:hypothetical protein
MEYFLMIYKTNQHKPPDQWLMAKVFKKRNKSKTEKYRPISHPCSLSKKFEKLILTPILEKQENLKTDLTGN